MTELKIPIALVSASLAFIAAFGVVCLIPEGPHLVPGAFLGGCAGVGTFVSVCFKWRYIEETDPEIGEFKKWGIGLGFLSVYMTCLILSLIGLASLTLEGGHPLSLLYYLLMTPVTAFVMTLFGMIFGGFLAPVIGILLGVKLRDHKKVRAMSDIF